MTVPDPQDIADAVDKSIEADWISTFASGGGEGGGTTDNSRSRRYSEGRE